MALYATMKFLRHRSLSLGREQCSRFECVNATCSKPQRHSKRPSGTVLVCRMDGTFSRGSSRQGCLRAKARKLHTGGTGCTGGGRRETRRARALWWWHGPAKRVLAYVARLEEQRLHVVPGDPHGVDHAEGVRAGLPAEHAVVEAAEFV